MDKINWTNGQTPLNQTNLNQMQTNIEKSAVAISSTQPATGEKVWIKKGKNLLNKNKLQNGAITANSIDSALDPNSRAYTTEWIECLSNKSYTLSNGNRNRWQFKNSSGVITFASGNTVTTASDTKYLRCYCYYDENSAGINNVNLQIEQNASATSYEAYISKKILTKNNNNVFEEFYSEILDIQEIPLTKNENYVYSTDFNVHCYKVGKLVIIDFCEIAFTTSPETGETIISGVPKPISSTSFSLFGNNLAQGDTVRLHISSNNINVHYKSPEHYANSPNKQYSGVVIYITNE